MAIILIACSTLLLSRLLKITSLLLKIQYANTIKLTIVHILKNDLLRRSINAKHTEYGN